MSHEVEQLRSQYKHLEAKHTALDQMYTESIRSNHELRTNILLRDAGIAELSNKLSVAQAELERFKSEQAACVAPTEDLAA